MRSLARIDFLGRVHRRGLGTALLLVGAALLGWQAWRTWQEFAMLERERAGLAALTRQSRPAAADMSPQDRRRHAQLDALAQYLAAPWHELLAVFEQRAPGQAVLQRIEQDAQTGTVRLTARARHAEAMVQYVTLLERDPRVSSVLLHQHESDGELPGSPLVFQLSAAWKGGGSLAAPSATAASVPEVTRP
jgi:hypothetical protein